MSLINQMLKDLDARRQQQEVNSEQPVTVAACSHKPHGRKGLIVTALLLLIVAFASAGWWYVQRQDLPDHFAGAPHSQGEQEAAAPSATISAAAGMVQPTTEPATAGEPVTAGVKQLTAQQAVAVVATTAPTQTAAPQLPAVQSPVDVAPVSKEVPPEYKQVMALEPAAKKNLPQAKQKATVVVSKTATTAQQISQLRSRADTLLRQHNYLAAAQLLQQAIDLGGDAPRFWRQLAIVYLQGGQLASSCQTADAGCAKYPHNVELRTIQARLLLETGNKKQALCALQLVSPLPNMADNSAYYALLATLQQQSGDVVGAAKNYAALTSAFPQRAQWWIGRAICAAQIGDDGAATRYFEQALRCAQLSPQLKRYALEQLQLLATR